MSWSIHLDVNTVTITDECAQDLFDEDPRHWDNELEYVRDGDTMFFNDDHSEHMDCVDMFADVLLKHKVNGDICFMSAEGDNAGSAWGYRFRDGVMTTLSGVTTYVEDAPVTEPK